MIPFDAQCTLWPDLWFGISLTNCCINHDLTGDDWLLSTCVVREFSYHIFGFLLAAAMFAGLTAARIIRTKTPESIMKRIIAHWAVTGYAATPIAKRHYHKIVEGNGRIVLGDNPISANKVIRKGRPYAAHTRGTNTGSIGISCAAMKGARSMTNFGAYPIKKVQFEAMCAEMARDCRKYSIPVTDKTVLSHAEVEKNLGIKQNGKWDIAVLPHVGLKGAKECGDHMRARVRYYLQSEALDSEVDRRVRYLQRLLQSQGYDLIADGRFGPTTKAQIEQFERDKGLPVTGSFETRVTVDLLRKLAEPKPIEKTPSKVEKVLKDVAAEDRTSTTNVATGLGGAGAAIAVAKEATEVAEEAKSLSESLISSWPILLAVVLVGGALWWIWRERQKKRKAAQEALQ